MSQADELKKLFDLYQAGGISQAEFEAAKAAHLNRGDSPPLGSSVGLALNRLRLANDDAWIAGVCGGIAVISGVDSRIWRLLFALGVFFGGFSAFVYLILWIFVPREARSRGEENL